MIVDAMLEEAFNAYLNLAKAELRPRQVKPQSQRPIQLCETSSMKLRRLVEGIEMSPDFGELVSQTLVAFPPDHPTDASLTHRVKEIGHFFRRSRCYMSLYDAKDIDIGATFRDLLAEFGKEQS